MRSHLRRRTGAILALLAVLVAAPAAARGPSADGGPPPGAQAPAAATTASASAAPVVSTRLVRPARRRVTVRRFTPWAAPAPARVKQIIAVEAARWGAPEARLRCRIAGESGFRWDARNGQYAGLGQFASSTLQRGVGSIGSRRVQMERRRQVRRWVIKETRHADGTVRRTRSHRVRTLRIDRLVGTLPRNPVHTHAWIQTRIMARAMVGLGAVRDSEWGVRC
jgi:hypothetical protein